MSSKVAKVSILPSSKHLSNPYVSAPVQGYPGQFILIGAWLFSFVMMRNLSSFRSLVTELGSW